MATGALKTSLDLNKQSYSVVEGGLEFTVYVSQIARNSWQPSFVSLSTIGIMSSIMLGHVGCKRQDGLPSGRDFIVRALTLPEGMDHLVRLCG